jgi:DeoR family transcriptional regulator, ulaG and ulaABCDEF operon transcriptional repressor
VLEREREETILQYLKVNRFASIHDLVETTRASEATVRRDLLRMDTIGLLRRVRGGAEYSRAENGDAASAATRPRFTGDQSSLRERLDDNKVEKRRIAAAAAEMCRDRGTVFIDGGSTTYYIAEFLENRKLTIVTNSLAIANQTYYSLGCRTVLAGGLIDPDSELVFDPVGHDFFRDYAADLFFLGVEGINESGITNTHPRVVQTARRMIAHSRRVVVLADSSKFGRTGHMRICGLDSVHRIITDTGITPADYDTVTSAGVELIVV